MIGIIILVGVILRILFPFQRYFDFDQEQIAVAAQNILNSHFTLIGPLAGTIRFFTGPLIYYVAAFWYWVTSGHPWAGTLLISSIFAASSVILWLILKQLKPALLAFMFVGIYSLSAHIVVLERVAWDPNFSFLAGALVLIGLMFGEKKWANFVGFFGMYLSYQAHFSAFVMAVGVVLLGFYLKRWRFMFWSLAGLLMSLLPTLIFDLRHDWLNSRGLIALLTNPEKVSDDPLIFQRFWHLILVSLENITKLVIPILPRWSLVGLGALILGLWLVSRRSQFNHTQRLILIIWIVIFPLTMMFYRGSTPEYYFLMQLPVGVFILTDLFLRFRLKTALMIILAGFFLIALGVVIQEGRTLAVGPSLKNKLQALKFIKDNPGDLVLDMEIKDRFGWNYLINYLKLPLGKDQIKAHLIYPVNPGAILSAKFGGIGVWLDRRGQVDAQAYVDEVHGILFYYPNSYWQLAQPERILFPDDVTLKMSAFIPQNLAGKAALDAGILYLYLPKNEAHKYFEVLNQQDKPGSLDRWEYVAFLNKQLMLRKTLARERKENLFIFSFPMSYSWKEIELFLSRLEGF